MSPVTLISGWLMVCTLVISVVSEVRMYSTTAAREVNSRGAPCTAVP
ncbi:Uncharacterised protein [Mycobacteroides abscessus subsp. abscessus]|nr:Uncharacterised protein [Mycobacteroides abscessus subsp. abscessus]